MRIGVHVGVVVYRGHDVYGDAVNIASRIVKLAIPGGVCVSQSVADDVRRKIDRPLLKVGRYELKNIDLPFEIYRVAMLWEGEPHVSERRMEFQVARQSTRLVATCLSPRQASSRA